MENSTRHSEYLSLHRERAALERGVHLWHLVSFPAAILVFIIFLAIGIEQQRRGNEYWIFLSSGLVLATLIILFARYYTSVLDRDMVRLFPRIIFLEIVLGYRFFRDFLRAKDKTGAAGAYIAGCEELERESPAELWEKVTEDFDPGLFPSTQRGHRILDWAAMIMVFLFVAITLLAISSLRPAGALPPGVWT